MGYLGLQTPVVFHLEPQLNSHPLGPKGGMLASLLVSSLRGFIQRGLPVQSQVQRTPAPGGKTAPLSLPPAALTCTVVALDSAVRKPVCRGSCLPQPHQPPFLSPTVPFPHCAFLSGIFLPARPNPTLPPRSSRCRLFSYTKPPTRNDASSQLPTPPSSCAYGGHLSLPYLFAAHVPYTRRRGGDP